ncbi:RIP metalloprotease RseP [Sphingobacterium faecale]|uniref:Zinc metalloprotease n=1 Tax=Sphingobacterium faecale TaxID=2803775 RepID=A0ABS1R1K1_9SPHI|nr:RIP metalloprotease RseP [Sphingobacterium faecale]MBL1408543.1 RIP metalloprotease RseP [Sphingobacterium faecale]
MGTLVMIGQVILALSILIILHELGHFLAARMFGIKVEKFYLFFDAWGVKLFKFNYKGCEYGIGWLPLGGYVKIAGMIDESMDTVQLKEEPKPWEFRSKPAWQRLIVMLGGIIVNVIVGIVAFWMITFKYGEADLDNTRLYGVKPGIIGEKVGLKEGDKIVGVNGNKAHLFYKDLMTSDVLMGDATLQVERGGNTLDIVLPATMLNEIAEHKRNEFVTPIFKIVPIDSVAKGSRAEKMGLLKGDSIIGINGVSVARLDVFQEEVAKNKGKEIKLDIIRGVDSLQLIAAADTSSILGFINSMPEVRRTYTFVESLPIGVNKAFSVITDNIKGFGKIFKGEVRADKALSGPVGIAKMFGSEVDWFRFWTLVGTLSMALAFMNLLPIPALDGGHVIFLLVEMVQGKPLSDKFLETAQMVGFFILIALMLFTFGNDILKW